MTGFCTRAPTFGTHAACRGCVRPDDNRCGEEISCLTACRDTGDPMVDREGFRPNVGIVLVNARNDVFLGQRVRDHKWQFPQGGIDRGETPVEAMYRELYEEIGLLPTHVKIIGRTRDWLRYEVPESFLRRGDRGNFRGQKQIWFLLRMVGSDGDICLRNTDHAEFDGWSWRKYWSPVDCVVEFKREVYMAALTELSRFLRRPSTFHRRAITAV